MPTEEIRRNLIISETTRVTGNANKNGDRMD
jgi:hypothetical protein